MGGSHDDVVLSESERERLAAMEEMLFRSDPGLVTRLGRRPAGRSTQRVAVAITSIVVGFALVILSLTFTRWLWLGAGGLAIMTGGAILAAGPLITRFGLRPAQARPPEER